MDRRRYTRVGSLARKPSGVLPNIWTPDFAQLPQARSPLGWSGSGASKLGPDGGRASGVGRPTQRPGLSRLSDLRGRLVPRDLIRLLAQAAKVSLDAGEGNDYQGRLLVPRALRAAVEPTSERKVAEPEEEIPELQGVFESSGPRRTQLRHLLIRLPWDVLGIASQEIDVLRRHGIVFGDAPPYEVPELFRRGLGLRHTGAPSQRREPIPGELGRRKCQLANPGSAPPRDGRLVRRDHPEPG